jgi:hypothetical protein
MRSLVTGILLLTLGEPAWAEVTKVTITTRATVADGAPFGAVGAYEKLVGTIEFAIDPTHPRNQVIADLGRAARGADGRVRLTSTLHVIRPLDASRGNGVLLFDIANRGRKRLLGVFNRAPDRDDPMAVEDFGDGFLLREGYTLVWVGWQFDVAPPLVRVEAPRVIPDGPGPVRLTFILNSKQTEASPGDLPAYAPANPDDPAHTLTVRDRFWDPPTPIARARWRLLPGEGRPRIALDPSTTGSGSPRAESGGDGGFEPGRVYEIAYQGTGARVAGVGLAAIRDAASAFLRRDDMPVRGRSAYAFGLSQSGRFLRQFLHDGFNVDEQGHKVFDAVWPHIAGAGLGSFNEPFAMPGYSSFPATRFPFTDREQRDGRGRSGGILASYRATHVPRVFYTNSSVEYWGQGRAAALTHVSLDGTRDADLPDTVRLYLIAGSQHVPAAFARSAPGRDLAVASGGGGQLPANPVPHADVMRALLRALHRWTAEGVRPPDSRYPRLSDQTLVRATNVRFPVIPGVANPRTMAGPGQIVEGRVAYLPFLVPQVDGDGNELAGIRVPEVAVPLATTTGWNFRSEASGNPADIVSLLGSYVPFAATRAEREARNDPRRSIEERYRSRADYLRRVEDAASDLVRRRYLLQEDAAGIVTRAEAQWQDAMTNAAVAAQ